jgi:Uma2 family endonuclease
MRTKAEATIEDLYRVPGKAELVNGEIVLMSPTGGLPGIAGDRIFASLQEYADQTGEGIPVSDNKAFIVDLPNRRSFSPDAAYYLGEPGPGFYEGAPVFAVEVRSEGDYGPAAERKIAAKIRDYFQAGTKVVWDVDVLREGVVRAYHASNPSEPISFHRGDVATAEEALPSWSIPVDRLFYSKRTSVS